ncbi:MAG: hypothetical protein K9G02_02755 [Microbacteriaceae bacterium]|nr:hypothetical protein [Microbacteriaceae bacterium]
MVTFRGGMREVAVTAILMEVSGYPEQGSGEIPPDNRKKIFGSLYSAG